MCNFEQSLIHFSKQEAFSPLTEAQFLLQRG
jgi:hypothetical protein